MSQCMLDKGDIATASLIELGSEALAQEMRREFYVRGQDKPAVFFDNLPNAIDRNSCATV